MHKYKIGVDFIIEVDDGISLYDVQQLINEKLLSISSGKAVSIEHIEHIEYVEKKKRDE